MSQEQDKDLDVLVVKHLERERHQRAMTSILRGVRYIMGYLPDMGFQFAPNFKQNPIEITLRIFWSEVEEDKGILPTLVKEKIEKIEKQLSDGLKAVGNSQISQSHSDTSTE